MKRILVLVMIVFALGVLASADTLITVHSGPAIVSANTSTVGSSVDPWTVSQTYTGNGAAILQFDTETGSPIGPGNPTGSGHTNGRWLQLTVLNDTGQAWTSFEFEIQSVLGIASTEGDGLSFGQGGGLTFSSNIFSTYTRIDIERDYINFSGGTVGDGDSVIFLFAITDNLENNPIWLSETPNKVDVIPEPTTLLLVGSGLSALGWRKRLKKS